MKLFINSGVMERISRDYVSQEKSKYVLSIPNYLEDERRYENIKFVFNINGINKESFKRDLLLENVSVRKTSENSYTISSARKNSERNMYALIRSTEIVPDDIFIPSFMKNKVTVLQRIRFADIEVDYGDFLANLYFIKITLELEESIPIYLTSKDARVLKKHYVIYRGNLTEGYYVTKKLETYILNIKKDNRSQYISLAELYKEL